MREHEEYTPEMSETVASTFGFESAHMAALLLVRDRNDEDEGRKALSVSLRASQTATNIPTI